MISWLSLGRILDGLRGVYHINAASEWLTGAIDVIVVEQPDGSFTCGPFVVRFGKLTAISPADKVIDIYVNGEYVDFLRMQLGGVGDAYFVETDTQISDSSFGHTSFSQSNEQPTCRPSSYSRRRRRLRVRHDTAQSEPDTYNCDNMLDLEFDELCPQSDGEQMDFPHDSNGHLGLRDGGRLCSSDVDLEWNWGGFAPRKISNDSQLSFQTAVMETVPPSNPSNIVQPPIDLSETCKPSTNSDGVYLDELVTSEVDPTFKETYIYVPPHSNLKSTPPENGFGCYDAGYRSDVDHSPRSPSPVQSSCLRLSLCGCPPVDTPLSDEKFLEHLVTYEEFIQSPDTILNNPNLTIKWNGKYVTWQVAAPALLSLLAFQTPLPHRTVRRLEDTYMPKKENLRSSWFTWRSRQPKYSDPTVDGSKSVQPLPQLSEQDLFLSTTEQQQPDSNSPPPSPKSDIGDKVNRLTSEQIKRLNLRPGRNDIEFRVVTKLQGTCVCSAAIFVWHWSDRLVISDVDGTITRSDVLGHVLPMLGHGWTHAGVTSLYTQIARNGYRFVYVTTRPLGHAGLTRKYLRQVKDSSEMLPEGPVLLSPNSSLHALHLEVIEKKPETFKIKCLSDVRSLFPIDRDNCSPFYAAFGNKTNDVFAYEQAGLPPHRIFSVNTRSEVRNQSQTIKITSYLELNQLVDLYFPVLLYRVLPFMIDTDSHPEVNESPTDDEEIEKPEVAAEPTTSSSFGYLLPPDLIDTSMYSSFTFWRNPEPTEFPEPSLPTQPIKTSMSPS